MFGEGLLAFGIRQEQVGRADVAARVFALFAAPDGEISFFSDLQDRAQERLDAVLGRGSVGPRSEFLLRRLAREATEPSTILSMGLAGAAFRLTRLGILSCFAASPTSHFLTRGIGAQVTAGLGALMVENTVFVFGGRTFNEILGRPQDWSSRILARDWASGALLLGSLRATGYLARTSVNRFPVLSSFVPQAGMFGGILLSHRLEETFGLRESLAGATTLVDSLATLIQFNVAGRLARGALGERFHSWERGMDRQTQLLTRQGFGRGRNGFRTWLSLPPWEMGSGREPAMASGIRLSKGSEAGGKPAIPDFINMMMGDGDGGAGGRRRSQTVPPDELILLDGEFEPITLSGIFPTEFGFSFQEGLANILRLHPHAVSVFEVPEGESFGKILMTNANFESLLGYAPQEIMEKSLLEFFHPKEARFFDARLRRLPMSGSFVLRDVRLQARDGSSVFSDIRGGFGNFGGKRLGIAFIEDVSQRMQAEASLRAAQTKNEALLRAIPDIIFRIHEDGTCLDVRAARGSDLTMGSSDKYIGVKVQDLPLPAELKSRSMTVLRAALETGEVQSFQYSIPFPDGTLHFQEARMMAIGAHEVVSLVRDITDLKRAEAHRIAAARLDAVQLVSRGLAHDANNAAAVEAAYLDLLKESMQELARLAETVAEPRSRDEEEGFRRNFLQEVTRLHAAAGYDFKGPAEASRSETAEIAFRVADYLRNMVAELSTVKDQSDRIQALIRGFKELTEAPQSGPPFNLHALLGEREIRAVLGPASQLEIRLVSQPWRVPGPKEDFSRVILNLVGNARDAMEGRPLQRLTIETEKVHLDQAEIERLLFPSGGFELKPGRYLRLSVSDTGAGMEERVRQRIFEPYFSTKRSVPEAAQQAGHSGLGLAITRKIIQDAKGLITVESEKGRGTTFSVYLPEVAENNDLTKSQGGVAALSEALPTGAALRERIFATPFLIVDDEVALSRIYVKSLRKAGFVNSHSAERAEEALELLQAYPEIGLVIADVGLPGMRGTELLAQLQISHPHLPLILWTGSDHADYRRFTGDLGAVFEKPVETNRLVETMQELIANSLNRKG